MLKNRMFYKIKFWWCHIMSKFCMYCGKPLLDEAKFCTICGKAQIFETTSSDNFTQRDQIEARSDKNKETIKHYSYAAWLGGFFRMEGGGYAYLTNKRFIYFCNGGSRFIDLQNGKFEVDVPFCNIKQISKTKRCFIIETQDNSKYKFYVRNLDQWFDIISKAMNPARSESELRGIQK